MHRQEDRCQTPQREVEKKQQSSPHNGSQEKALASSMKRLSAWQKQVAVVVHAGVYCRRGCEVGIRAVRGAGDGSEVTRLFTGMGAIEQVPAGWLRQRVRACSNECRPVLSHKSSARNCTIKKQAKGKMRRLPECRYTHTFGKEDPRARIGPLPLLHAGVSVLP